MDANDESLNRWKASLGIIGEAAPPEGSGPKVRTGWPYRLDAPDVVVIVNGLELGTHVSDSSCRKDYCAGPHRTFKIGRRQEGTSNDKGGYRIQVSNNPL